MAGEIRNRKRAIPEGEAKEILRKCDYGVLSTVSEDGAPYGVPMSYVYNGGVIYFHCAMEGHKLNNIKNDNRVSFCVVGNTEILAEDFSTKYESTIVFGKAYELSGDEKTEALLELVKKYSPQFVEEGIKYIQRSGAKTGVYKIVIESMTGKARR